MLGQVRRMSYEYGTEYDHSENGWMRKGEEMDENHETAY